MRFRKTKLGYLKLGFIFMIFSSIISSLLMVAVLPAVIGTVWFGGPAGIAVVMPLVLLLFIFVEGWFIYWFYTENKFTR